jgi:hypothetical protein
MFALLRSAVVIGTIFVFSPARVSEVPHIAPASSSAQKVQNLKTKSLEAAALVQSLSKLDPELRRTIIEAVTEVRLD